MISNTEGFTVGLQITESPISSAASAELHDYATYERWIQANKSDAVVSVRISA